MMQQKHYKPFHTIFNCDSFPEPTVMGRVHYLRGPMSLGHSMHLGACRVLPFTMSFQDINRH